MLRLTLTALREMVRVTGPTPQSASAKVLERGGERLGAVLSPASDRASAGRRGGPIVASPRRVATDPAAAEVLAATATFATPLSHSVAPTVRVSPCRAQPMAQERVGPPLSTRAGMRGGAGMGNGDGAKLSAPVASAEVRRVC
ncbi:MAG: hypothetical protein M3Q03_16950 [Chloroflexota bacterium]|nr:hypothetical protein [Chloroflexota bacterium]